MRDIRDWRGRMREEEGGDERGRDQGVRESGREGGRG